MPMKRKSVLGLVFGATALVNVVIALVAMREAEWQCPGIECTDVWLNVAIFAGLALTFGGLSVAAWTGRLK